MTPTKKQSTSPGKAVLREKPTDRTCKKINSPLQNLRFEIHVKNVLHVVGQLSEEDVHPECLTDVGAGDGPHRHGEQDAAPGHASGPL